MSRTEPYRPDIDGLRAVAVLSILLFHLEVPGFAGGYVGVDVFFVISGYLITRNILARREAGRWSFRDFYGRRLRRLFPAIFFTLALSLVAGFLLLSPGDFARLAESALWTGVLAPNLFFWERAGYFAVLPHFQPLLHFWSLGVEEQYYLLWPLLLVALLRAPRAVTVVALAALAALSVGAGERWLGIDPSASFYLLPLRASGLLLGGLLAFVRRAPVRTPRSADLLLLLGLLAIGYAVIGFDAATPYPGLHALVPVLGTVLAIHTGEAAIAGRLLRNRPMVAIGLISFSLYLVHWPLLVFYRYWTLRPLGVAEQAGIALTSLAAAGAMYWLVEQPFRAGRRNRLTAAGFASACLALMLPLMFVAAHVWGAEGLPWRLAGPPTVGEEDRPVECRPARKRPGCLLGVRKLAREDVLLIGDSHAQALSAGIDDLARRHGLKVRSWIALGCPPLFDVQLSRRRWDRSTERRCADERRAWKAYILERRPPIVMLAGRWTAWVNNEAGLAAHVEMFMLDPARPVRTKQASAEIFATALARTTTMISELGSKLVVFSSLPELGLNPSACYDVPRYLIDAEERKRRCQFSYDRALKQVGFVDETIARLEGNDVMPVIPRHAFCDDRTRTCAFFRGRQSLFRDAHHLSSAGSRQLARYLEPDFARRLRRWRP